MASLRGVTSLWTAADAAGAFGASAVAHVGSKPYVAVFVQNTSAGPLTFRFQVATAPGMSAGMNEAANPTDVAWHAYYSWSNPIAPVEFVVPANTAAAVELSPFSPELMRLVCVEGFSAGEVIASLASSGPN
jgi:hypothetical protein